MNLFFTEPPGLAGQRAPLRDLLRSSKFRQLMRISFVNMVLLIGSIKLLVASPATGQDLQQIEVKLELSQAPLKAVFKQIESQTDLLFVYPREVNGFSEVTLVKGTYTVKEALDKALAGTSLKYRQTKTNVVIFVEGEGDIDEGEEPINVGPVLQRMTISGQVVDASSQPIPGVNVLVKGTTRGTTSDADGRYAIEAESHETLVFSFIGCKSVSVMVDARTTIDVTLEQDIATLNEVTVNGGYYETTDKLKTGSIVKVTAKDIENQPVTSPLMALQGRVPGLEITPTSGTPGIAPTIRIRGTNSLRNSGYENNGNYPLYVIDGVPVNSSPITSFVGDGPSMGGYDPLSTLNPSSILSIEVLKDADATAIYGSRGANGVILITTKRNTKRTERIDIDLTGYIGTGKVSRRLDMLNTSQYLSMRREAFSKDNAVPGPSDFDMLQWDSTRYTDWQKILIGGNADISDLQGTLSSGTKNTTFQIGGGYHKETMVFPGDFGYSRITGQMNLTHISEDKRFSVSFQVNYGLDNNKLFDDTGGVMTSALTLAPNAPRIFNDDGTLNWEIHEIQGNPISTWRNPFGNFKNIQTANTRNLVANTNIGYELLPGLSVSTNAGYTDLSSSEKGRYSIASFAPTAQFATGVANFNDNKRTSWIFEPKLRYGKQVQDHKLDLVVGFTLQRNAATYSILGGQNYTSDALLTSLKGAGNITNYRDDENEYKYLSVYARIGYNWKEKYLINLTGRRDGSSRFGQGNRFGNFSAIGTAWIFSNEKVVQENIRFLNLGKIRASYGITGSDQIGDYKYYDLYEVSPRKYQGLSGLTPYALNNPDYAWEVTRKLEVAIELGFFDGRIGFEIDWYRNRSSNQLVEFPLSAITGFPSVLSNFGATVENSGWETVIHGDVLSSTDWRWTMAMNATLPRNKLVKFDGIEQSPYVNIYKVGEPLSVRWLYVYKGINPETGIYEVEDQNYDGLINDKDRILVNLDGFRFYGGFTNTVQYKRFELSIHVQFSRQKGSRYMLAMPGSRSNNQSTDVLRRWRSTGDETDIQRFSTDAIQYQAYVNAIQSNFNITDASFIRLKTLNFTWRMPQEWSDRIKLQDLRCMIQGQNLLTITGYPGLDPETANTLPPLQIFTLGIQARI